MGIIELRDKLNEIDENLKVKKIDNEVVVYIKDKDIVKINEKKTNQIKLGESFIKLASNNWLEINKLREVFKYVLDYASTQLDERGIKFLYINSITKEFLKRGENLGEYVHTTNSKDPKAQFIKDLDFINPQFYEKVYIEDDVNFFEQMNDPNSVNNTNESGNDSESIGLNENESDKDGNKGVEVPSQTDDIGWL